MSTLLIKQLPHKVGDTYEADFDVFDDDLAGAPANLTNIDVVSRIKWGTEIIMTLEVVWVNRAAGQGKLISPAGANMANWPADTNLLQDIQFTAIEGGRPVIKSTETFYILTQGDVS